MQLQNAAERFRQALREAKDRDSMLAVSREMLAEVEALAARGLVELSPKPAWNRLALWD